MTGISDLPVSANPVPPSFPHFPAEYQAVIWRNWEMAPAQRLADVLKTTPSKIVQAAQAMGLPIPPHVDSRWLQRGYITIIRNNWHLLPYEQLLQLLGWNAKKLDYVLREDDFLWHKLGDLKPDAKAVYYRPLTAGELKRTAEIRKIVQKNFPDEREKAAEKPFAFLDQFGQTAEQQSGHQKQQLLTVASLAEAGRAGSATPPTILAGPGSALRLCWFDGARHRSGQATLPTSLSADLSAIDLAAAEGGSASGGKFRGLETASHRLKNFDLRLVYSYAAVYGDPLLEPALDPYPDDLLACYRDHGINGVWLQGILYTLIPWDVAPELSRGYEKRLENLRRLTERAARFGIGVYLYLNEPRPMPLKFFERYPQWKGAEYPKDGIANLCTSQKEVLSFLENGVNRLFREVPDLTGVFTITMSENPTNCYSKGQVAQCPRCSKRRPEEVIAEVNRVIERGIHRAKPDARVIVWTWAWGPEWEHAALDLLPDNVEIMCVSEWGLPTNVGNVKGAVRDYSISQVGPAERARKMWAHARQRGLKTIAKVQINNSWECSAVPYIPTPDLVEKHLQNLSDLGVGGLMAGWTLGGYPGGNLELLRKTLPQMAEDFGQKASSHVRKAHKLFSSAFTEFPFHIGVLYMGPQNVGPANLLYDKPTGYKATMVGFPYDDLDSWRAIYPPEIFEKQLLKLSAGWQKGLTRLKKALRTEGLQNRKKLEELLRIATAVYCHFRSVYLQTAFIRLRGTADKRKILEIVAEEQKLAVMLYGLMLKDSRIGFEASNHYYYTKNTLKEKALNCEYLRRLYSRYMT